MINTYTEIHNAFKLNNSSFTHEELKEVAYSHVKEGLPFEKIIGDFLIDWLNDKNYILVSTSGSTGTPKTIKLKKQAMVNSALATGNYFGLEPGNKALHCLPTKYIAGKMMLVRAMILGLELDIVEPTSQPIFDYEIQYGFSAMVPMQLEKIIGYCQNIKILIVGGTKVSNELLKDIKKVDTSIYETYGMTETVTHIAVKQLNNFLSLQEETTKQSVKSYFKTLPNVTISQDNRNCLIIDAPNILEQKIVTNDIVALHSSTEFEWLGRYDNMINSGGIKIFPEQVELKLQDKIEKRFFIAKETDNTLGEHVVLVLESASNDLNASTFKDLKKYEIPKAIYTVSEFIETANGKIQRQKTLQKAKG